MYEKEKQIIEESYQLCLLGLLNTIECDDIQAGLFEALEDFKYKRGPGFIRTKDAYQLDDPCVWLLSKIYHPDEILKDPDPKERLMMSRLYELAIRSAIKLFDEDKTQSYFSENNADFLEETGVGKNMRYNDEFLRPYMVSNCNYDILLGAANTCTPFRYEINYRNYLLLTQGSAQIKLAPPHSTKYLYPIYDYENFEFKSPVNPWNPQPKYIADFDKMKCLEFTLLPGKTLYIPSYWWYSIKFNENASISCFNYRTYVNNLAISPYICLHALQIQNVKRNVVKKHNIEELNKNDIVVPVDNEELSNNDLTQTTDINNLPEPAAFDDNIGAEL